jgi:hypothetical protein
MSGLVAQHKAGREEIVKDIRTEGDRVGITPGVIAVDVPVAAVFMFIRRHPINKALWCIHNESTLYNESRNMQYRTFDRIAVS